jgi:glycosyltransferase involved in cell wall biosynthesis
VIHHGANDLTGADEGLAAHLRDQHGPFWLAFAHHPHKNVETLLTAVALNRARQGPPIRLAVVGDGSYVTDTLRPMAAQLGVEDAVSLLGRVSSGNLLGLYRHGEGLLFPSRYEGFGLPVLEAMANECPVICSDICSLPEVAGDAAILTGPDDADAILGAISRLRGPDRDRLIEKGRARARHFTWERAAAATATLYHAVLAPAARRLVS